MSTFQWQEADCVMFYAALRQTEWSTDAVLPHFRNVFLELDEILRQSL
jgi:hypothetical protein